MGDTLKMKECDTCLLYTSALCAGDPRIKERMDLDVEVSRLKLMKADHQSKQYRLEDQLLKYFPEMCIRDRPYSCNSFSSSSKSAGLCDNALSIATRSNSR